MTFQLPKVLWSVLSEWKLRDFPWRNTRDPWVILVAETLLQQTNASAVPDVFAQLLGQWPTPKTLVNAPSGELRALIGRLGLQYRADRLQQMAVDVIQLGGVPRTREGRLALKGVGPYIADAVGVYAFGEHVVPVDSNIIRLTSRLTGWHSSKARPHTDVKWGKGWNENLPQTGDVCQWNWALLDFSSAVCRARSPLCRECPMKMYCIRGEKSQSTSD
ncbi:MAG: glycosylase [Sulfobacillus benefaciens]|uniref:Glycosylase n=1 Tax=Sulfobacillus benefaciens TaxID=453960 RepID=A0A2T2X1B9_9FIRM|nr:MAG: glycosylase [Sulfobacillus benefaciens]